jgi:RHS repeat-associated protein
MEVSTLMTGSSVCTTTARLSQYKFTGKERDTESGNDYFGARYYASSMGRMMSPDPIGIFVADVTNPQSWNLYSYVMNNPLKFIDPSGEECVWDDGSYDASDDKQTGSAGGCTGQGGTFIPPSIFEGVQGNQAGSWSGQASSSIASSWLGASVTVFGGPNAAQQEVNNVVSGFFTGTSPQNIEYQPQDPFTLSFQKSAGMDAINAKIAANCPANSGKVSVGSGEAFVNTLIDGVAGGQGFDTPEAQLGAFNATYTRDGGTASVTVTNPISLNSAAYHATTKVGIQNPTSGPMSTVNQTLHIQEGDPCQN